MDRISQVYYQECLGLDLNVKRLPEINGFRLTVGDKSTFFRNSHTPFNRHSSALLTYNPYATYGLLKQANLPVSKESHVSKQDFELDNFPWESLKYPLMIKPSFEAHAVVDTVCNIPNAHFLKKFLKELFQKHEMASLESFVGFKCYSFLVAFGEVVDVVLQVPAHVVGDGSSSLKALIESEQVKRLKSHEISTLLPFVLNKESDILMLALDLDLEKTPDIDRVVPLRYVSHWLAGGGFETVSIQDVHLDTLKFVLAAVKELNLNCASVSVFCHDIHLSLVEQQGFLGELQASVNIIQHCHESFNQPQSLVRNLLNKLVVGELQIP